jgi:hypothetical protein
MTDNSKRTGTAIEAHYASLGFSTGHAKKRK